MNASDFPKFLPIDKKHPLFHEIPAIPTKRRYVEYKQTEKIELRPRFPISELSWLDGRNEIDIHEDLLMPDLGKVSASKSVCYRRNSIEKI